MKITRKNLFTGGLILTAVAAYLLLGYQIPRTNFQALAGIFAFLFGAYYLFLNSKLTLKNGLLLGLGFRLLFLFAEPALSDDYYRFLWDGYLWIAGENPFLHLPVYYAGNNFLQIPGLTPELFAGLNSPRYFSVYPPVCQLIFGVAAYFSLENLRAGIIVMRVVILLAEMGTFWLLVNLLAHFKLPPRRALWYALNPLVIVELTGNLHFEAVMIFFTLAAFYFLTRKRYQSSAIALGLAISTKLIPLLILPFIFKRTGFKKGLIYCTLVGFLVILLWLPFLTPELISHLGSSLNLYFQKFEFNASIYNLLRWLGYQLSGYNQIAKIGILLSAAAFLAINFLAFREKVATVKNLPQQLLFALTVYYLLATIVHPWYLTVLVALAPLTHFRYPLVWSGLAVLSYAAYLTSAYTENPWLTFIEYTGLALVFFLEKRYGFKPENPGLKSETGNQF